MKGLLERSPILRRGYLKRRIAELRELSLKEEIEDCQQDTDGDERVSWDDHAQNAQDEGQQEE